MVEDKGNNTSIDGYSYKCKESKANKCNSFLLLNMKGVLLSVNRDHNHEPSKIVDAKSMNPTTKKNEIVKIWLKKSMRETPDPLQNLTETEFVKTFRLGKETVKMLAEDLTPHIPMERRRNGIPIMTKILTTLAFLATGSYQALVGQSAHHNVSQPTVSRSVRQVVEALNKVYHKYVIWPRQSKERNIIKSEFYKKFGIPGVLGCIDGTHVAIIKPQNHERFYNSKGFHSLNVMIICDANLNLLCVDPSIPGSAHDSDVWESHPLSSHLAELTNNGESAYLLGDNEYPLRNTIMTPILNTEDGTPQHYFHIKQVSAHNTVERCIGVLKARFRCLLVARTLHYDPVMAGKIVNACAVLHNIANATNAPVPPLSSEDAKEESIHQQQIAEEFSDSAEISLQNNQHSPVKVEHVEGQALQQVLVNRLWTERK